MPEEEKELTVEEMRRLISLDTLLPDILNKIKEIENSVNALAERSKKLTEAFNQNVETIKKYKTSVDNLASKQVDSKELQQDLKNIKEAIARIEMAIAISDTSQNPKPTKKDAKQPTQKTVLENKDESKVVEKAKEEAKANSFQSKSKEELDAIDYGTRILASSRGRKTRTLTLINVKKAFDIDDEGAQKVLDWLESKKVYNPKTHILTFKK